jgi:hypothetical protein
VRDLYQMPAIKATVNLFHVRQHYMVSNVNTFKMYHLFCRYCPYSPYFLPRVPVAKTNKGLVQLVPLLEYLLCWHFLMATEVDLHPWRVNTDTAIFVVVRRLCAFTPSRHAAPYFCLPVLLCSFCHPCGWEGVHYCLFFSSFGSLRWLTPCVTSYNVSIAMVCAVLPAGGAWALLRHPMFILYYYCVLLFMHAIYCILSKSL